MHNLRPILASHDDAAKNGLGRAPREFNVPSAWPGTYVPNLSEWRKGDIVLVEGTAMMGRMIRTAQGISWNSNLVAGRRWTHAAIYVGDGEVVDACFGIGVQRQSLWNYCHHRAISRRRIVDPDIPVADVARIADVANSHIGKGYAIAPILLAKMGWASAKTPNPDALYCSTFVSLVVAQATQIELTSDPLWQPPYPGVFASHPDLITEESAWRNI